MTSCNMHDLINKLKREVIEYNYQIGFDKADDRKEQITELLKESGLAFNLDSPGNDLFAHAFSIDNPNYTFVIFVRFDRDFFTVVAYKRHGHVGTFIDDEDLINKSLGPIFLQLENLGLSRIGARH